MVFTSLLNWGFLAVMVGLHWLLPRRARPYWLAVGSVTILAFNDFAAALLLGYLLIICLLAPRITAARPNHARHCIWLLVIAILIPLVLFKYQLLTGAAHLLAGTLLDPAVLAIPLGISYITIKAIMYLVDTGRGRYPAQRLSLLVAYLAFAPAATSGPIDRPLALIKQFSRATRPRLEMFIYAGYRITTGIILKFAIADVLMDVLRGFTPEMLAASTPKLLAFGPIYAVVIFCDFAGYSHIAIGVAALFGMRLMENFAGPYLKPNIREFWRAWHISLTSFLADYIFTPLANLWARPLGKRFGWNTGSLIAASGAAVVTFLICGVWHGDGLNFLLWGLYHGILLSAHHLYLRSTRKSLRCKWLRQQRWLAIPATVFTFALVSLGWYLFAMPLSDLLIALGGAK